MKNEREHLVITPFFRTETPPLGAACLIAYMKQFDVSLSLTDYRIEKNIVDTSSFTVNHLYNYAGEFPDLPLVQSVVRNYLDGKPLLDNFDDVLRDFLHTRNLNYFQLQQDIKGIYRIFKKDIERLSKFELIGFTTYTSNIFTTVLCVCLLKRANPEISIVLGGPQVTESRLTSEYLLTLGLADAVVLADGEESFRLVIEANRAGESLAVAGTLTYNEAAKKIVHKTAPILRLDNLPCPDFSGIDVNDYGLSPGTLPLYSSRGCPFKCEFCNEWKMWERYRRISVDTVVDWMDQLHAEYGTTKFHMADSLLNSSIPWIESFADCLLERGAKYQWYGYFRAKMTYELAVKLKAAGLCKAFIGTEAFTDEMLVNMRKQRTMSDNISSTEAFCAAGIVLELGNVIGFPGETQHDFDCRRQFYYQLHDKYPKMFIQNSEPFRLVPGSGAYAELDKFNIETIAWSQEVINANAQVASIVKKIPMAIKVLPSEATIMQWMRFMDINLQPDKKYRTHYQHQFNQGDVHNRIAAITKKSVVQFNRQVALRPIGDDGKIFEFSYGNEPVCFLSKTERDLVMAIGRCKNGKIASLLRRRKQPVSIADIQQVLRKIADKNCLGISITNHVMRAAVTA